MYNVQTWNTYNILDLFQGYMDVSDCADPAFSDEEKQKCKEALKTKQVRPSEAINHK